MMEKNKIESSELDMAETTYVRDIENRVFQAIVLQVLTKIEGISLLEGNLIDAILNRGSVERVKGIYVEQDSKNSTVNIKVEINIAYGISIPEKSSEIQVKIAEEIANLTGLHVGCVHVIIKNMLLHPLHHEKDQEDLDKDDLLIADEVTEEEYANKF